MWMDFNREDFKNFMKEHGFDVEFDSTTPGFFDKDNNLICSIDELLPENLEELLMPPFDETRD